MDEPPQTKARRYQLYFPIFPHTQTAPKNTSAGPKSFFGELRTSGSSSRPSEKLTQTPSRRSKVRNLLLDDALDDRSDKKTMGNSKAEAKSIPSQNVGGGSPRAALEAARPIKAAALRTEFADFLLIALTLLLVGSVMAILGWGLSPDRSPRCTPQSPLPTCP